MSPVARVRMGRPVMVAPGVCVLTYRATDGTLVLEIEGADRVRGEDAGGPVMRVYLNDGPIFQNPPYRPRGIGR